MATDALEDEELRFCFNIDVTEDEFYQNNEVQTLLLNYPKWGKWLHDFRNEICQKYSKL